MHKVLRQLNCDAHSHLTTLFIARIRTAALMFTVCCLVASTSSHQVFAQSPARPSEPSSVCKRDDALEMIGQQVAFTRTFDNAVQRIDVLIRAADLLWEVQQDKARSTFTEAFEVAIQHEKDLSARSKSDRSLLMFTPDRRYLVVRAVAKRDSVWAKKLTEQILKLDRQSGEQASTKDQFNDVLTGQKLLDSARQLISTDVNTAINLAGASLKYPATVEISRFLYALAEKNQPAADQFYDQALVVYADRPMREFLYLQAYPFAFREAGDMPVFGNYEVPANFVINNSLQRRFVLTLLQRALQALETPLDEGDNFNGMPGTAHILQVFVRIEPQVKQLLPDLSGAVVQAREKILVSLPVETQNIFQRPGRTADSPPQRENFQEQIETAEKTPNVSVRDDLIASAVLGASDNENLESVVDAIDKISDSGIRVGLRELLYFKRAKDAASGKRFDEAERLVSKVEGREQRAYLRTEIAKGLLKTSETQTHAREVLDEAIDEANKAGMTISAARTLLTASSLYAKIDPGRSISLMRDAIELINRIEVPDFSVGDQTVVKTVKRRSNPGRFVLRFFMPGLDPETAFREMAWVDFDGTLFQSSVFTDKFQRSVTTLALAEVCLRQAHQQPKQKSKKIAKP
jgi:hypothetical protein